jgi:uncharacterized protein (DUF2147 family)
MTAGVLILAISGCSSADGGTAAASATNADEVVRMWIEPELVECTGVGPMECMQVAYTEDGEPELFYSGIEGFEFVEGTSYVIDVQVSEVASPPADGSSLSYTLVEVVSETPAQ